MCSLLFEEDPVKHLPRHDPTELLQEEVCVEKQL